MPANQQPLPSGVAYNEALQTPSLAFVQTELRGCIVDADALGLPRAISGQFGAVYKVRAGAGTFAIKVFNVLPRDHAQRYDSISKALARAGSARFVRFEFQSKGILVAGAAYPLLRMDWVEGETLGRYIERHVGTNRLHSLAEDWVALSEELLALGVAHGDLQHGNVLCTRAGLRLVDYDGMFVPALKGLGATELGHRHYQHPLRSHSDFGPHIDNFAVWMIHVSLVALEAHPELWREFPCCGDDRLLFAADDLARPASSRLFAFLRRSPSAAVREATGRLEQFLQGSPADVPPLTRLTLASGRAVPRPSTPAGLPDWMNGRFSIQTVQPVPVARAVPAPPPPPSRVPAPPGCRCGRRAISDRVGIRGAECGICHGTRADGRKCTRRVSRGRSLCHDH